MKIKVLIAGAIVLAIIVSAYLVFRSIPGQNRVCFKDNCFFVELAVTPMEHSRGLMFREELDSDKGMLFIFGEEGVYSFWMKNTLIPLDIIWIDSEGRIVFISKNTQPCLEEPCPSINPGKNTLYVLEINGGVSEEIGLAEGDELVFYLD